MTISGQIQKGVESPVDFVDQAGLRKSNCFYCKVEELERNLHAHQLKSKKGNGGDVILICKNCYGIIIGK